MNGIARLTIATWFATCEQEGTGVVARHFEAADGLIEALTKTGFDIVRKPELPTDGVPVVDAGAVREFLNKKFTGEVDG